MKKISSQPVAGRIKAVGYARVSTPEQAEKDLSLPAQIASIRRYAQDRGLALAGEFVERGVSGTDDNRPEFRRMLEEIYRPNSEVGMVIVTHGSRFMRNATPPIVRGSGVLTLRSRPSSATSTSICSCDKAVRSASRT